MDVIGHQCYPNAVSNGEHPGLVKFPNSLLRAVISPFIEDIMLVPMDPDNDRPGGVIMWWYAFSRECG